MTVTEIKEHLAAQRARIISLECASVDESLTCEQILTANLAIEFQIMDFEDINGLDRDKDTDRPTS